MRGTFNTFTLTTRFVLVQETVNRIKFEGTANRRSKIQDGGSVVILKLYKLIETFF